MKKPYCFALPVADMRKIARIAREQCRSRTAEITLAIRAWIQTWEKKS